MASQRIASKTFSGYLHDGKVGVIDIGSNSIRLVVYDGMKRVPLPIYNEKAFCSLAKGIGKTNRLNPEGVRMARRAIARLLTSVKLMDVVELHIIATAAVRDADDGKVFVKELERAHGVKIKVISGKREARLAAMGILSTHYQPKGITGDLGGGSLELISLSEDEDDHHATTPLGPLRVLDQAGDDRAQMRALICDRLDKVEWLGEEKAENFYAIGGSFRSLAKIHMDRIDYPLELLHEYAVKADELLPLLTEIADWPADKMDELPSTAKRQEQMPVAAMILQEILQRTEAKQVVFSTSGIREGLLYDLLSPFLKKEDPLISSCAELSEQSGRHPGYPPELYEWTSPFFTKETASEARLRLAACILSELAWRLYRPFRGEWSYHRILQSSLVGISHVERVMLAAALYHRYKADWKESWKSYGLLSERERAWAKAVGASMNMGYYLSGGLPGNLHHVGIRMEGNVPKLRLSKETQSLQGETYDKRMQTLTHALTGFAKLAA